MKKPVWLESVNRENELRIRDISLVRVIALFSSDIPEIPEYKCKVIFADDSAWYVKESVLEFKEIINNLYVESEEEGCEEENGVNQHIKKYKIFCANCKRYSDVNISIDAKRLNCAKCGGLIGRTKHR